MAFQKRHGEVAAIAIGLVVAAVLVLRIPLVFGPNGYIDPYGYREYDEPETVFQIVLSWLAIVGPIAIGGLLMLSSLRKRR